MVKKRWLIRNKQGGNEKTKKDKLIKRGFRQELQAGNLFFC